MTETQIGVLAEEESRLHRVSSRLSDALTVLARELSARNFSRDEATAIADGLLVVAKSGELTRRADGTTELWEPLVLGQFTIGAHVRVRRDAYGASQGALYAHNGKEGDVAAARGGMVYVRYTGEVGGMSSVTAHRPNALQLRVTRKGTA